MEIKSSGKFLGATIYNFNLSNIDINAARSIREALLDHLVLVFPRQTLTPHQLLAAAQMFGAVEPHGFLPGLQDCPEVLAICKRPEDTQNFGSVWHSDNSYLSAPPMGALLHAQVVPSFGGNTEWSSQYAALSSLSQTIRSRIDNLRALHASNGVFGALRSGREQKMTLHPLVHIHPESGRAALFHSGPCTVGLEGVEEVEAKRLSNALLETATHPDFRFQHAWRPGDVVFWDNRCTMHRALNDYPGQSRLMHRVTIRGTPPIPALYSSDRMVLGAV